jgi:HKD family nuclease
MIVEYIGQGLYDEENLTCGNQICSALKSEFFTEINFFVAFLRRTGLSEIVRFLKKAKEDEKEITFFVGIDQKVTSRQALEKLIELKIPAYIYNSSSYIYHPKVYLFEGAKKNRVIVGSSNFTNNGLFNNVEASVLFDFSSHDKSGIKFLNQLKDYFAPLLEFDDPNLNLVTADYIKELDAKGLLSNEDFDGDSGNENFRRNYDNAKKANKNRDTGELGNIEISENSNPNLRNRQRLKITDDYKAKWPIMFEKLKQYKKDFKTTVVSKKYEDRTLFGWYRKQKEIHNSKEVEMPREHYEQLIELDKDFFVDGKIKLSENSVERWLEIIEEAIADGEDIGLGHGYIYKGEKIGTFLQGISRANKNGKKLDVRYKIEKTGFRFSKKSRNSKDTLGRFIEDLLNDKNPDKKAWLTRLDKHIPKKEDVDSDLILKVEEAWELQFNEKPTLGKLHDGYVDRTEEWKNYRYTNGFWYPIKTPNNENMGLYSWVKRKFENPKPLIKLLDRFNETELQELRALGFQI